MNTKIPVNIRIRIMTFAKAAREVDEMIQDAAQGIAKTKQYKDYLRRLDGIEGIIEEADEVLHPGGLPPPCQKLLT